VVIVSNVRIGKNQLQAKSNERTTLTLIFAFILAFQAKGDALAMFIATESMLRYYDMSLEDWENMYDQRVQLRLEVLIKSNQLSRLNEDQYPFSLQQQIQSEIDLVESRFEGSRVVFKPCVRKKRIKVMIETLQEYEAKQLAYYVVQILDGHLN
jgi:phosphomannomutase